MGERSQQGSLLSSEARAVQRESVVVEPVSDEAPQLSDEDLARVEQYLSSPIHQVERQPFRPWFMMLALVGVVTALSLLSLLISWLVLG